MPSMKGLHDHSVGGGGNVNGINENGPGGGGGGSGPNMVGSGNVRGGVADEIKRQTEQLKRREEQRIRHKNVIRNVLEKTARLRKESKARRHRDLQNSLLDDAVDSLTDFVEIEWPPPSSATSASSSTIAGSLDTLTLDGVLTSETNSTAANKSENNAQFQKSNQLKKFERPPSSSSAQLSSNNNESTTTIATHDQAAVATKDLQDAVSELNSTSNESGKNGSTSIGKEQAQDNDTIQKRPEDEKKAPETPKGKMQQQGGQTPDISSNYGDDNDNSAKLHREAVEKVKMLLDRKTKLQKEEPMHQSVITALEAYCLVMRSLSKTPKMCETALECVSILVNSGYVSGEAGIKDKGSRSNNAAASGKGQEEMPLTLLDYVIESTAKCSESSSDLVHIAMSRAFLALVTCKKCGIHEAALLVSVRSTFHVYLVSKTADAKEVSRATLLDMLKAAFNRMEAYDAIGRSNLRRVLEDAAKKSNLNGTSGSSDKIDNKLLSSYNLQNCFNSQYHTDAYLLFRALCKLSAKTLPDEDPKNSGGLMAAANSKLANSLPFGGGGVVPGSADPLALHSKILSLELILAVFEHCGDAFRNGDKFIYAVQNYLCVSLLKNCMSIHTDVAYMSLKIFLVLVYNFKAHLKSEIEVFMANIFLRVLESPNSSFDQKALVLEALRILCSDPAMLTQLFLNYDCDFDAVDLYKNIVRNLTRVSSKPRLPSTYPNAAQDAALCQAGLEVLIVILQAFLKVLNLAGGDDEIDDSMSTLRSKSLHLDIASAISSDRGITKSNSTTDGTTTDGSNPDDTSSECSYNNIYVKDVVQQTTKSGDGAVSDMELSDVGGSDGTTSSYNNNGTKMSTSPHSTSTTKAQKQQQEVAEQIVGAFDRKRTVQKNFETGTVRFTLSLKGGLLYFIENGFVTLDARDIAGFLYKHQDRLDKTQIGEALGKEPESSFVKDKGVEADKGGEGFFVRILHHYVHQLDFTDMEFDDAIRFFLSGFRLPGEAQKIDRIMEKFAERYTRQNEEVFPSADTAFILAFSVIMLNTDLHNPNIKPEKRMTVESFLRNNRGISVDGGDLPEDMLRNIFRRIEAQPFSLKEDDEAREKNKSSSSSSTMRDTFFALQQRNFFGMSAEERKRETFRKEREEMMAVSEQLFKKRPSNKQGRKSSALYNNSNSNNNQNNNSSTVADKAQQHHTQLAQSVSPSDVVKPMFDVTWGPLIGTLSQILETTDDQGITNLCLNGFVYSVRISAHSDMSLARDTFVNALTKFTTLGSIKEMKFKNIESIQTLLSIAIMDGEHLGESWGPVLQCISHLARLQSFATGGGTDDMLLRSDSSSSSMPSNPNAGNDFSRPGSLQREESKGFLMRAAQSKSEIEQALEAQNAHAVLAAVNEILIDKVYSSTVNLSATSMAHFVEQLIRVSAAEISGDLRKGGIGVMGGSTGNDGSSISIIPTASVHTGLRGKSSSGSRTFSLQKLVEVADYNMDARPRIAWTQMWEEMAKHFATIGCHENAMVSMFAIDALRQLSFKFLQKPELYDFNFQRVFLKPFLSIMENPGSRQDIRELVLRCIDNMIRTLSHNLRSGWKIFFQIITLSAEDPSEKISTLGLAILQRLLDEHLEELCLRHVIDDDDDEEKEDGPNGSAIDGHVSLLESNHSYISGRSLGSDSMNGRHVTAGGTALQRRVRNANAEDFVDLCLASLAFVQTHDHRRPLPVGLSMRALCHTACYSDLIALGRVLPPCTYQTNNPDMFGYTYEGLDNDNESKEMVLWKPILDGLASGICSKAKSNSGGVGCLVQRGSVMTLRSILLRHGHVFTCKQWKVIIKHVILPSIQSAAENDLSPVTNITSETPVISNLDFLSESLPQPPTQDDNVLRNFAVKAQSEESAPKRALGPAELLVEASFADLRHGGDGDLSRLYGGTKRKSWQRKTSDQPFPDSWVATTSAIAIGTLTDIFIQYIVDLGHDGRTMLWPLILSHYKIWILGPPLDFTTTTNNEEKTTTTSEKDNTDDISILEEEYYDPMWRPSEALTRIGSQELNRIPPLLAAKFNSTLVVLDDNKVEIKEWWKVINCDIAETIQQNVILLDAIREELIELKQVATINSNSFTPKDNTIENEDAAGATVTKPDLIDDHIIMTTAIASTAYGQGKLLKRRQDQYANHSKPIQIWEVSLEWGGTLYGPEPDESKLGSTLAPNDNSIADPEEAAGDDVVSNSSSHHAGITHHDDDEEDDDAMIVAPMSEIYERFVPAFKIRCVAACLLQQLLYEHLTLFVKELNNEHDYELMLNALNSSREFASRANKSNNENNNNHIRDAFQELLRLEAGGVEQIDTVIATANNNNSDSGKRGNTAATIATTGGSSESFFIIQEASANRAMIHLLSTLYKHNHYETFAEPILMKRMDEVFIKFLDSDKREGLLLEPSIWKKPYDHYTNIPLYCTAFCGVIISFLQTVEHMTNEQFVRSKEFLYPILCQLVQVQSNEVRRYVSTILMKQVAPLLNLRDNTKKLNTPHYCFF